MGQKEIICYLLDSLHENVDHSKRMNNHMARFDVDMDLFRNSPLENAACDIVTTVIADPYLVYWWIYRESDYYTPKNGSRSDSEFLHTAQDVWDYYFKKNGAEEAQN